MNLLIRKLNMFLVVWVFLGRGGGGNKKCQYLYINVYFVLQTWTDTGFRTVGTSNGAPPIDRIVRYVVDMGYPAIQQYATDEIFASSCHGK